MAIIKKEKVFITSLGQRVNNRWDYLVDEILKYLYNCHDDPFNSDDIPVLPERIAQDLDLPLREVVDILRYLETKKQVEPIREGKTFYRIAPEGIACVERLLYR